MRETVFIGRRRSALDPQGLTLWGTDGEGGGGAVGIFARLVGTAEKSRNNGEPRLAAKKKKDRPGADRPYLNRRYVVLGSHFGHRGDNCDDCGAGCITISRSSSRVWWRVSLDAPRRRLFTVGRLTGTGTRAGSELVETFLKKTKTVRTRTDSCDFYEWPVRQAAAAVVCLYDTTRVCWVL